MNRRDFIVQFFAWFFGISLGPQFAKAILTAPVPVQDAFILEAAKTPGLQVFLNGKLLQENLDYVEEGVHDALRVRLNFDTVPNDVVQVRHAHMWLPGPSVFGFTE